MDRQFPAGFSVEHDGQIYEPLGIDGSLINWRTACPACGSAFEITTTLVFRAPRRRCDDCKRPGLSVSSQRKRLRQFDARAAP